MSSFPVLVGITTYVGSSNQPVVSLTSLTGGIGSAPIEGDTVIAFWGAAMNSNRNLSILTEDYTQLGKENMAGSGVINRSELTCYAKRMGATPDTSVQFTAGSGSSGNSWFATVLVFRGVNADTVLDVARTFNAVRDTRVPVIPAITPVTSGSLVVCGAISSHKGGLLPLSGTALPNTIPTQRDIANETHTDGSMFVYWGNWNGSPFAGETLSISGNSVEDSYVAFSFAIRPAPSAEPPPEGTFALNGAGSLTFIGGSPTSGTFGLSGAGGLTFFGGSPTSGTFALPGSGELTFTGRSPANGTFSLPGTGELTFTGRSPTGGMFELAAQGGLVFAGDEQTSGKSYMYYYLR
jgi:hypothetical protein